MKEIITIEIDGEEAIRTIKELKQAIKEQQKQLEDVEFGSESYKKQEEIVAKLKSTMSVLTAETKKQAKELTNLSKIEKEKSGSMNRISMELAKMKKEYKSLSKAELENEKIGGVLLKNIVEQDKLIKELDRSIGNHHRNVGNYKEALDTTNMSLGEMRKELAALRNMSFEGLKPEELNEVKMRMGELTAQIKIFQGEIKTTAQMPIQSLVSGLKGIIASSQLVTGTLSMFGVENKNLEKTMVQLIGVAQGLATIEDLLMKKKLQHLGIQIKDMAVKSALAVKTGIMTAAQWAWNVALNANPIGAIIMGIMAFIGAIVLLVKNIDKVIDTLMFWKKGTEDTASTIEKNDQAVKDWIKTNEKRQKQMEYELELMKAQGKSIEEIEAKERENLKHKVAMQKIYVKNLVAVSKITGTFNKQLEEQKEILDKMEQDYTIFEAKITTRKKQEAEKRIADSRNEAKKRLEAEKKAEQDCLNELVKYRQLQKDLDKNFAKDDMEKEIATFKTQTAKIKIELKKKYADGLIDKQEYDDALIDLEVQRLEAEILLLNQYDDKKAEARKRELDLENLLAENKIALNEKVAQEQQKIREKELEDLKEKAAEAEAIAKRSVELLFQITEENDNIMENFSKGIAVMMLDILQKQVTTSITSASVQAMAQPDSVTSFGVSGLVRAGILTGIIEAIFSGIKSKILAPPKKASRGMYIGGKLHNEGGTLIEAERGEVVINRRSVAMFPDMLSKINMAGGGVPLFENGGIVGGVVASHNTLLAENSLEQQRILINAIKNIPPPIVMVEEMNTKLVENNFNQKIGII